MQLGEWLDSINTSKKNLIRTSASKEAAVRLYPAFPVMRSLSYHEDSILLVQELNTRGLATHGVSNQMHYEFLLHVLGKRKRFAKWEKPAVDESIEIIMMTFDYSRQKAEEVRDLFSDADILLLKAKAAKGGKQ